MPHLLQNPDDLSERVTTDNLGHYPGWIQLGDVPVQPHPQAELVKGQWRVPLPVLKAERSAAVMSRLAAAFIAGFTPADGPLAGHTLQVRDQDDRTNWLTSQAAYRAAIDEGAGNLKGATFRTAANRTVECTFDQGHAVLLDMASWGRDLMTRSWMLKDSIAAARDEAALMAVAIDEDWPGAA